MFFFIYKELNTVQSNHFMKFTPDPRVIVELVVRLIVKLAMQTRHIPFSWYYEVSGVITNSFFVKAVKSTLMYVSLLQYKPVSFSEGIHP